MTVKELKKQLERFTDDQEIIFTFYHQTNKIVPGAGVSLTGKPRKTLLINDTITNQVEIYNTDSE